jgi:Type II secretion system (T2SS), protein G
MTGNCHVRFLGGNGVERPLTYPIARENNMANKKRLAVVFSAIVLLAGTYLLLNLCAKIDLGELPPENGTSTRMYPLKTRILRYAKKNNKLPSKLSDLPPLEGFSNFTKDYWGNDIIYQVNGSTVTLLSYGKDQKPGGAGDNLDVVGVFEAKNEFGQWVDENSAWKIMPLQKPSI